MQSVFCDTYEGGLYLVKYTPVQIRIFPDLEKTVRYAKMLERAGAWLVAVHGRTREQKDAKQVKADWNAIRVCFNSLHGRSATLLDQPRHSTSSFC